MAEGYRAIGDRLPADADWGPGQEIVGVELNHRDERLYRVLVYTADGARLRIEADGAMEFWAEAGEITEHDPKTNGPLWKPATSGPGWPD